jgi:hypothetical protein
MTTLAPASLSPVRLLFWRFAARLTEFALRHRAGMIAAWPYLQLVGGGLTAYGIGRLIGAWAMNGMP